MCRLVCIYIYTFNRTLLVSIHAAQWYLNKGLADEMPNDSEGDLTVRLNFIPNTMRKSGTKSSEAFEPPPLNFYNEFYVQERANICVVCGMDKFYQRFSVIPKIYRHFMPEVYKSHRPHDVVLLCKFEYT
jgi:hypothetical protein